MWENSMILYDYLQRPKPFERAASIWTDPFIAPQMLRTHLDPATDLASYRPKRLENTCTYLYEQLHLVPGCALIDLGCGPGLYAERFAQKGIKVTGLDISESSIEYAREQAKQSGLDITYNVHNYCKPIGKDSFDAAILIWEDYGVLSPIERNAVLHNVFTALHSGGRFALDVATDNKLSILDEAAKWYTCNSGFFRPHPHVVIEKTWIFPEEHAYCETSVVVDDKITVYHNHLAVFSPERITKELEMSGFCVASLTGNLEGKPYSDDSMQIGVVAYKP
jgi:SAM-dependent methyltransferase